MTSAGWHAVQVSLDAELAADGPDLRSEVAKRQAFYARVAADIAGGAHVTVVVLSDRDTRWRSSNLEVIALPRGASIPSRMRAYASLYARLLAIHRADPIDVITTQTPHDEAAVALAFGLRHRVPVVGQVHYDVFSSDASSDLSRNVLTGAVRRRMVKWCLRHFAAVRVVGTRIARTIEDRGIRRDVRVIPVPVRLLSSAEARERGPGHQVLYVGRLVAPKDLETWLHVAVAVRRRAPAATFEIVGDGPDRAALVALASNLGLDDCLVMRGHVPNEALPPIYAGAAVFLLTSRYEGFGRVLVEAQAFGLPVVTSRVTGTEDIVVDGVTGYLVEPGDVDGFADRVVRLLTAPEEAAAMGERGLARVSSQYDPDTLGRQWVEMLFDVSARAGGRDVATGAASGGSS